MRHLFNLTSIFSLFLRFIIRALYLSLNILCIFHKPHTAKPNMHFLFWWNTNLLLPFGAHLTWPPGSRWICGYNTSIGWATTTSANGRFLDVSFWITLYHSPRFTLNRVADKSKAFNTFFSPGTALRRCYQNYSRVRVLGDVAISKEHHPGGWWANNPNTKCKHTHYAQHIHTWMPYGTNIEMAWRLLL